MPYRTTPEAVARVRKRDKWKTPKAYLEAYTERSPIRTLADVPYVTKAIETAGHKRLYAKGKRDINDVFKDAEFFVLDRRRLNAEDEIAQRRAELEQISDAPERQKRQSVLDSLDNQRKSLETLQKTKLQVNKLKFYRDNNLVAGKDLKTVEQTLAQQEDYLNSLRNFSFTHGDLAETLNKLPAAGRGEADPKVLKDVSDLTRKLKEKELELNWLSKEQKVGRIRTVAEIPATEKKALEKNVKNEAELLMNVAYLTGRKVPGAISEMLGGVTPEQYVKKHDEKKSWWENKFNPLRHAVNILQVPSNVIGGALHALSSNIDYQLDPTGAGAKVAEKYPWIKTSKVPFLEGAVRAINDPWSGEGAMKTMEWIEQLGEHPETRFLKNKWVSVPLSLAFEFVTDPVNVLAPGTMAAKGKAVVDVSGSARKAKALLGMQDAVQANKYADHALDIAKSEGLIDAAKIPKGIDTFNVAKKLDLVKDIKLPARMADRIAEGYQVGLGVRKGARVISPAMGLPGPVRKVEAAVAKPFSTAMEMAAETRSGKIIANTFGVKSLMKPLAREAKELDQAIANIASGKIREGFLDVRQATKGIDDAGRLRVGAVKAGALDITELSAKERKLLNSLQNLDWQGRLSEVGAGLSEQIREPYFAGIYSGEGKLKHFATRKEAKALGLTPAEYKELGGQAVVSTKWRPNVEYLKEAAEGQLGVRPEGETISEVLKNIKGLAKEKGVPFEARRAFTAEDILPLVTSKLRGGKGGYEFLPEIRMRGKWEMPGGTAMQTLGGIPGETTLHELPKHIKSLEEATRRFGPYAPIDPVTATMSRYTTAMQRVGTEAFRKTLAEMGQRKLTDIVKPGTVSLEELGKRGRLGEISSRWTKMLEEPRPYWQEDLLRATGEPAGLSVAKAGERATQVPREFSDVLSRYIREPGTGAYAKLPAEMQTVGTYAAHKIDSITNLWKGAATAWRPGFHLRNFVSNLWQMSIAGAGEDILNPVLHRKAITIMRGKNPKQVIKLGDKSYTVEELRDYMYGVENVVTGGIHGERAMDITRMREIGTRPERWGKALAGTIHPFTPDFPINVMGRAVGRGIENEARSVLFLSMLEKTGSPSVAGDLVQKFLFNYDDITRAEKQIRRFGVPFYTWLRKDIPLQIESMIKTPQKFTHLAKAANLSRESGIEEWGREKVTAMEKFMPAYFRKSLATLTPFKWGDNPLYFSQAPYPWQDVMKMTDLPSFLAGDPGQAQDIMFSLSPLLKAGLGWMVQPKESTRLGISETERAVPNWYGKMLKALHLPATTDIQNPDTRAMESHIPGWEYWLGQQFPPLQDILRTTKTSDPNRLWNLLGTLAGVRFMPLDWKQEYQRQGNKLNQTIQDILNRIEGNAPTPEKWQEWIAEPKYEKPKLKTYPAADAMVEYMTHYNMPITKENIDAALEKMNANDAKLNNRPVTYVGVKPKVNDVKERHQYKIKVWGKTHYKGPGQWVDEQLMEWYDLPRKEMLRPEKTTNKNKPWKDW